MDDTLLKTLLEGLVGLKTVHLKSLHYIFFIPFQAIKNH